MTIRRSRGPRLIGFVAHGRTTMGIEDWSVGDAAAADYTE
jgi:hypothetical protein